MWAQKGFDLEIKKPAPYENRLLKAEKSGKKKFSARRRFFQNTYTHYNYFFNANNKLNEVLARAKQANRDDFSKLLPYYNYSLETTKQDETQLDSIIYKAKTGIVMHDLRNDWIDDLYLLWGASYLLQQEYDSARRMFQFINHAFAPKEKDGYYRYIGSRMDGGNAQTIVTTEDASFLKRLTTDPPSRNNAFIWQVRTLTEQGAFSEAGSLLAALRQDPAFPERLLPHLAEVQGYWFYKQQIWDSAAHHLSAALPNAQNAAEKARWEYLIGQLYDLSGKSEIARDFYDKAIGHTPDPVLDIWARLALVRNNKEGGEDYIAQNIAELEKMARREKFQEQRDVIYAMLARMELERNNPAAARAYMLKATKAAQDNPLSKNANFLTLADLSYQQKQYRDAASFYDSLDLSQVASEDAARVTERKGYLGKLLPQLATVQRQDSLQRIAALPEDERSDYLKKLARQLRRQRGLSEDENAPVAGSGAIRDADALTDPFRSQSKGEWYFYNQSTRTSGAATFKQVWGARPNVDNWRRASSAVAQLGNNLPGITRSNPVAQADALGGGAITAETLLQSLPLTAPQLAVSNDSIRGALLGSALVYINEIEDYPAAIAALEELRRRFPDSPIMPDALYQLHFAQLQTGNSSAAAATKQQLLLKYPHSRQAQTLQTGIDPEANRPTEQSTKAYEAVYDMFLEGRFTEAKRAKQVADSTFQTNYWNPQLLFIEAVYHIKQVEDSTATDILNRLVQQDPEAPIAKKAANLMEVLARRKQIEEELRNLNVERMSEEDQAVAVRTSPKLVTEEPATKPPVDTAQVQPSTVVKVPEPKPEPKTVAPQQPVQKPVAQAPVTQTKQPKPPPAEPEPQLPTVRRDTAQAQTTTNAAAGGNRNSVANAPGGQKVALPKQENYGYMYEADRPHYAVVILNKVDNIFGNEARTAFDRFNRGQSSGTAPAVQLLPLDGENKLLLIGAFPDVLGAINYVQETKPVAASQIVPWLKAEKFSFTVISEGNLEKLKATPDLKGYQKFLETTPVKF
jgi:outer membrane protein assembly factor BamD (BamD/ComL family)